MPHTFEEILKKRFDRRALLGGLTKAIPAAAFAAHMRGEEAPVQDLAAEKEGGRAAVRDFRLQFDAIAGNSRDAITVASGHRSTVLIGWGDPLFSDSPAFNPESQSAAAQARQFGYNVDWLDLFPLPGPEVANPRNALIVVNHEYTNPELMFKNWGGFNGQTSISFH